MKVAGDDWTDKWAPAIIGYAKTLKGKTGKVCMDVLEDMFSGKQMSTMYYFWDVV